MKHTLNSSRLIGFVVLGALVLLFASTTKGLEIKKMDNISDHISRLHSLYLWKGSFAGMITDSKRLNITNGLVVWNSTVSSTMATVGWGLDNNIKNNSQWAWIAGWQQNKIENGQNSVIGWGNNNNIWWNNAVVAGWQNNKGTQEGAVVLWWYGNESSKDWMVFWGSGNKAQWANSLVLWEGAKGNAWSFAWNGEAVSDSARIDASNWILINTYDKVDGVNLVVNWAIKIWGQVNWNEYAGEIRMISGCFYAYDWVYWHVVNQSAEGCNVKEIKSTCRFGNVELQPGDVVTAFKNRVSANCAYESAIAICDGSDWKVKAGSVEYPYPYCYKK